MVTPYLLLERTLSKDGHYAGVGEEQDSTLPSELCHHLLIIHNKSGFPRGHRALWEAGGGGRGAGQAVFLYKESLLSSGSQAGFCRIGLLYDTKWFASDPVHKESKCLSLR